MSQVWLITGSSRGLGRAFAEAALAAGCQVAATARKAEDLAELKNKYGDLVLPLVLDVARKTIPLRNNGRLAALLREAHQLNSQHCLMRQRAGKLNLLATQGSFMLEADTDQPGDFAAD